MYYNGSTGYSVNRFLNMVHKNMVANLPKGNNLDQKAIKLQQFFYDLKQVAHGGNSSIFDQEILQTILDNIFIGGSSFLSANAKMSNLFKGRGTAGGFKFERELAAIIEAVWNQVGVEDFQFDKTQVLIGGVRGGTADALADMISDKKIQQFLANIGTKAQRNIETNAKASRLKEYYLPEVDGKIDVQGYEIQIRENASAKMVEIYNLLKDVKFSAKNYASMTWDEKIKEIDSLSLGKSNILRAIYNVLTDQGYSHEVAISAIFHGYNRIVNKNDQSVAEHFYHLRFIYELTGAGFIYSVNGVKMNYGQVNYIIFNDPSTDNIYVKSTQDILADILKEGLSANKQWSGAISLGKAKFY